MENTNIFVKIPFDCGDLKAEHLCSIDDLFEKINRLTDENNRLNAELSVVKEKSLHKAKKIIGIVSEFKH